MANKVFELNGKAYDALTGAYLGTAGRVQHTATVQAIQPKAVPQHKPHNNSVDGIVRRPAHKQAAVSLHQRTQPTKTLMRHAVKAPAKQLQPKAAPAAHYPAVTRLQSPLAPATAAPTPALAAKLSSNVVDPMRARRSRDVNRSQAVQHFKAAPHNARRAYASQPQLAAQPQTAQAAVRPTAYNSSVAPAGQARPAAGQRQAVTRLAPAATARQHQAVQHHQPAQRQDDDDLDIFAQALAEANSHEQQAPKESLAQAVKRGSRKRRQLLGIVGSLALFLLLAGFIGLQNKENIRLQLASAKAGFTAAVPLNKPAGYNMEKLSYAPGNVAMQYKAASNQGFTITQKKSNWDSQTLLENFVATSNQDYQGYQSNGRTVYIYGKGQATWVNGGIWYQIKDANSLTNEQLVRIAASM